MAGYLGEKLGEGLYADVHVWAPGQVVKLFKADVPARISWWEARLTRAVFAAGGPAPDVLDEVTVDGRFGVVMPRLDGPTLRALSRSGAIPSEQVGEILATLARSVHQTPPPANVPRLHDALAGSLRLSEGVLPDRVVTGVLSLIERLAPQDGLCHGDLHSDNVVMTPEGPRIIDWVGAVRAPPAFDLATCHVLLAEIAPETVPDPERPRAVGDALHAWYARLAGITPAALTTAMTPYLPVVRVRVLIGPAGRGALREGLLRRVEADLGSDG